MTTATGQRKSAATRRDEIMRTALELAFQVGPSAVSTGMIARQLGITQPALYKHFRNKQDIWAAIGQDVAARIDAVIEQARCAPLPPQERIRLQVEGHLRLIETIPALPDILLLRDRDETLLPLRNRVLGRMSAFRQALIAHVQAAVDSGAFAPGTDPEDAASLLMGLIQTLVLRMVLSRRPGPLVPDGRRLLALLMRGFLPQPETAP